MHEKIQPKLKLLRIQRKKDIVSESSPSSEMVSSGSGDSTRSEAPSSHHWQLNARY